LVAVFGDGLIVRSKIEVLDVIVGFPVIIFKQGDVDGPLELGGGAGDFAVAKLSEGALADLLAVVCQNGESKCRE